MKITKEFNDLKEYLEIDALRESGQLTTNDKHRLKELSSLKNKRIDKIENAWYYYGLCLFTNKNDLEPMNIYHDFRDEQRKALKKVLSKDEFNKENKYYEEHVPLAVASLVR